MEYIYNNKEKLDNLNEYMKQLLTSSSKEKVKLYEKYESYIKRIEPMDLFYLDMYKDDSNYSIEEIKETANAFVNAFHVSLSMHEITNYDHIFFQSLYEESLAIESKLDSIRPLFKGNIQKDKLILAFEELSEIEKKFIKYENILFPRIEEKVPSNTPLKVLWSLHDDSRSVRKDIIKTLKAKNFDIKDFYLYIGDYYFLIYGLNKKQQLILHPVAMKLLSNKQLDIMYNETLEYGYAFLEEKEPIKMEDVSYMSKLKDQIFNTETGELKLDELELILNILPIDVTFVDKDNLVKYYNNTTERAFPRNPSIIGREVKNCHPPKSVHVVEKIIESFRNNEKSEAEFWLNFRGRMIYITYLAVRNKDNEYLGVLEVSQDVTHIRGLQGERRLLDW